MNAKEARSKAQEINEKFFIQEWLEVNKAIKEQVDKGEFEVSIFYKISDKVKEELEKDHFKVTYNSGGFNETDTIINW